MARNYLIEIICGECSHLPFDDGKIKLCALLSLPLLLKLCNIFLLAFTNSKLKVSSLRKKSQLFLFLISFVDTICALCPIVFLPPKAFHTNFPFLHLFDAILSISSSLMNKDLLRSRQLSCYGLLSAFFISLLITPPYFYLSILSFPNFFDQLSSLYFQSILLVSMMRMILSLLCSGVFSYHLAHLIDPITIDDRNDYRSLSNTSSNNIPLLALNFDITQFDHTNSWESPLVDVEIPAPSEGEDPAVSVPGTGSLEGLERKEEFENYYQALFLSSISPIFRKASQLQFKGIQDMPPLSPDIYCHHQIVFLSTALRKLFQPHSSSSSSSSHFFFLLFSHYASDFFFTALLLFFKSTLQFLGPIMLQQLVLSAQQEPTPWSQILGQIFILFFSRFLCSFLDTHYHLSSQLLSIKISGALKGTLFGKMMTLSSTSRLRYTIGNLTNLYTVDIDRTVEVLKDVHNFWALPLQVNTLRLPLSVSDLLSFTLSDHGCDVALVLGGILCNVCWIWCRCIDPHCK
jgi:hypothetical protein